MRIAISGATGLIGSALCRRLKEAGHGVVALLRNPSAEPHLEAEKRVRWDVTAGPPPVGDLEGLDAVVHLAGTSIAGGRWTRRRKPMIRDSRVQGTRNLVEALRRCQHPPKALLSSSAIGYYGPRGDERLHEESSPGTDFLAAVCTDWEQAALPAGQCGMRVVLLRTGIVLSTNGGALARMLFPFRLGVGGPLGSGGQWMSWIHIEDEIQAILHALDRDAVQGPLNLTAPNPATNEQFSRQLAKTLHRPCLFRVPGPVLRLLLGEMAENLLLRGQRVVPQKLEQSGYRFRFPTLAAALKDLL